MFNLVLLIELPDFKKTWDYENNFYLSCDLPRISKFLAHYELYKKILHLPGHIVECGIFKGASFSRFAVMRELFENPFSKKLIGFDTFGKFPKTKFKADKIKRKQFIDSAGENSISVNQLKQVLNHKGIRRNIDLVKGDITKTVPKYVKSNPGLKISLLNLDTDIYEPARVILENLFPLIVKGGILIVDDYGVFPGETKAVDEYFRERNVEIKKFPFAMTPCYIIK